MARTHNNSPSLLLHRALTGVESRRPAPDGPSDALHSRFFIRLVCPGEDKWSRRRKYTATNLRGKQAKRRIKRRETMAEEAEKNGKGKEPGGEEKIEAVPATHQRHFSSITAAQLGPVPYPTRPHPLPRPRPCQPPFLAVQRGQNS